MDTFLDSIAPSLKVKVQNKVFTDNLGKNPVIFKLTERKEDKVVMLNKYKQVFAMTLKNIRQQNYRPHLSQLIGALGAAYLTAKS